MFEMAPAGLRVSLMSLIMLWFLLSPLISPELYTGKLFHPRSFKGSFKKLLAFSGARHFEVPFQARDGSYLRGWVFLNDESDRIILVHPGNSGDIPGHLDFIKLLLESGASVFFYEPRGFGHSGGSPSIAHILEDGEDAFDCVIKKLGFGAGDIVVMGVSLGCAVAAHVAKKKNAAKLIMQSGFSSLAKIARENVPLLRIYPSFLFPRKKLDNEAAAKRLNMPVLFLHGLKDSVIAPYHTLQVYAAVKGRKDLVLLKNSDHTNVAASDRQLYVKALSGFISIN